MINAGQIAILESALSSADASNAEAQGTLIDSLWGGLIGAGSAASAAEEDKRQTAKLNQTLHDRLDRIRANPEKYGEADAVSFLQACKADSQIEAIKDAGHMLSVSGALEEVGGATLSDLGSLLRFGVPVVLVAVVVVAALYLKVRLK